MTCPGCWVPAQPYRTPHRPISISDHMSSSSSDSSVSSLSPAPRARPARAARKRPMSLGTKTAGTQTCGRPYHKYAQTPHCAEYPILKKWRPTKPPIWDLELSATKSSPRCPTIAPIAAPGLHNLTQICKLALCLFPSAAQTSTPTTLFAPTNWPPSTLRSLVTEKQGELSSTGALPAPRDTPSSLQQQSIFANPFLSFGPKYALSKKTFRPDPSCLQVNRLRNTSDVGSPAKPAKAGPLYRDFLLSRSAALHCPGPPQRKRDFVRKPETKALTQGPHTEPSLLDDISTRWLFPPQTPEPARRPRPVGRLCSAQAPRSRFPYPCAFSMPSRYSSRPKLDSIRAAIFWDVPLARCQKGRPPKPCPSCPPGDFALGHFSSTPSFIRLNTTYLARIKLRRAGDIQENPGPKMEDYKLIPEMREIAVRHLGCAAPRIDAFASSWNAQFPCYWDENTDAFAQEWIREIPLWMNFPFSILPAVVQKLQTEGGNAIIVCPVWSPAFPTLRAMARREFAFPDAPLYLKFGSHPMPKPKWHTWAFQICKPPLHGERTKAHITYFLKARTPPGVKGADPPHLAPISDDGHISPDLLLDYVDRPASPGLDQGSSSPRGSSHEPRLMAENPSLTDVPARPPPGKSSHGPFQRIINWLWGCTTIHKTHFNKRGASQMVDSEALERKVRRRSIPPLSHGRGTILSSGDVEPNPGPRSGPSSTETDDPLIDFLLSPHASHWRYLYSEEVFSGVSSDEPLAAYLGLTFYVFQCRQCGHRSASRDPLSTLPFHTMNLCPGHNLTGRGETF